MGAAAAAAAVVVVVVAAAAAAAADISVLSRPELIVHSNLPIIQILCSHLSSLLFK